MTKKSETGKLGEDIAYEYLKKNGYSVIDRNFRRPWGEVDIIAKDKKGILVFVEVKTMEKNESLKPEDNLTSEKLKKMKRTASIYANSNEKLLTKNLGWRIDLVAIELLTDSIKDVDDYSVRHYENI